MDELLVTLRKLEVGYYVGDVFMGVFGYADGLVLLAPSRGAMQLMLNACQDYANSHNLVFSTDPNPNKSKSKCIIYMSNSKKAVNPMPLKLYGVNLPWVQTATLLGNELCEDGTMDTDIRQKRASFIDKSLQIREQFSFAHPIEVLQAVSIYCCDHYGAIIWDLGSSLTVQYYNAWNTCIKLAWRLPRSTHRYFLDFLSGGLISVRSDLIKRYAGFYKALLASPNREVGIMARVASKDIRSSTARNLRLVEESSGGQTWLSSRGKIIAGLRRRDVRVPMEEEWRINLLGNLLERRNILDYQGLQEEPEFVQLQEQIDSLCTS